tara:strand:+ start:11 stop:511 length:501 start_codon:yes stop_codon:yes gene_type:complete
MALSKIDGTNFIEGTVPSTVAPGAGKVLQVVQGSSTTSTSTNTTSYADTSLSVSITPSSTSSKIYIIVNQTYHMFKNSSFTGGSIRLLRDSTTIYGGVVHYESYISAGGVSSIELYNNKNLNYLDSPSSTSALTYKTQSRAYDASLTFTTQFQSTKSTITAYEIAG